MPVGDTEDWLQQQGEDAGLLRLALSAFRGPVLGVAVSGGSDSLALLHLAARLAPFLGAKVRAVTVDHALRDGSASEAEQVGRVCAALGVSHDILVWQYGAVAGNLMQAARHARYTLIADWARGCPVAVAHTADDQAETFLMGLARRAGLDGLSGMRPEWQQGTTFLRPLLTATRADLRAYLMRHGVAWIDDPSNYNPRFTRVKARRTLQALAPLGISTGTLAGVVQHLAAAQEALQQATLAASAIVTETAGALHIDRARFAVLHPEIARRLLLSCLRWITNAEHAPRGPALDRLCAAVGAGRDSTLAGCRIRCRSDIHILREPRAVGQGVATDQVWDNRWRIWGPHAPDLTLRALGTGGLRAIKDWRACGIARDALLVSPSVWRENALISAPLAGFGADWTAGLVLPYAKFMLSH